MLVFIYLLSLLIVQELTYEPWLYDIFYYTYDIEQTVNIPIKYCKLPESYWPSLVSLCVWILFGRWTTFSRENGTFICIKFSIEKKWGIFLSTSFIYVERPLYRFSCWFERVFFIVFAKFLFIGMIEKCCYRCYKLVSPVLVSFSL